jgi:hypothetical protein
VLRAQVSAVRGVGGVRVLNGGEQAKGEEHRQIGQIWRDASDRSGSEQDINLCTYVLCDAWHRYRGAIATFNEVSEEMNSGEVPELERLIQKNPAVWSANWESLYLFRTHTTDTQVNSRGFEHKKVLRIS